MLSRWSQSVCSLCKETLDPNRTVQLHPTQAPMCYECFQNQKDYKSSADPVTPVRPPQKLGHVPPQEGQGKGAAGLKDDGGKLMWNLLPWKAVEGMIKVLTFGAKKYSPNGWRTVPSAKERYLAALLRHIAAMHAGETVDKESGLRHIDHALCNAAFLAELEE